MDKIGVSIIGCGGIAQVHLSALVQMLDQVRLVAAVDIVPEKARAAAEQYGIERWSASIDDALGSDTDVVFVCTPTNTHHQCAVPAFNAGKHVFCEKPLDRTLVHAQEILDAQKRSGKVGAVGFVRRYDQEWLLFRSLTQSGAIGRPVLWQDIAASSGPALHWFNLDEEGGGPFLDGAIHTIRSARRARSMPTAIRSVLKTARSTPARPACGFNRATSCSSGGPGACRRVAPALASFNSWDPRAR